MADGIISKPNTFFALLDKYIPIVPVPQYKSYIISEPLKSASFFIMSYNFFACFEFVWKKESGDILNLYFPSFSVMKSWKI